MSNFRLDSGAVLLIFSQKHFDLYYRELKSFLSFPPCLSLSLCLSFILWLLVPLLLLSVGALFILFTRIVVFGIFSSSFLPLCALSYLRSVCMAVALSAFAFGILCGYHWTSAHTYHVVLFYTSIKLLLWICRSCSAQIQQLQHIHTPV